MIFDGKAAPFDGIITSLSICGLYVKQKEKRG